MATPGPESTSARRHRGVWLTLAAAALLAAPLVDSVDADIVLAALVVLVVTFGLPHGALDPLVARAAGQWRTRWQLVGHLLAYTGIAAGVVVVWLWLPLVTLGAFLILSAWHFGDDWPRLPSGHRAAPWQRGALGAAVVAAPVAFHPQAVAEAFAILVGRAPDDALLQSFVTAVGLSAWPALVVLVGSALAGLRRHRRMALELAALPALAWALPPLVYFIAYFCFLHSPRHLIDLHQDERVPLDRTGWAILIGLTLTTVAFGALAFALAPGNAAQPRLLQVVFIGLAALTVPHMLLIERFRRIE
jgi:Brp/Blh family beta-carotene 15,15'-monooxygenase